MARSYSRLTLMTIGVLPALVGALFAQNLTIRPNQTHFVVASENTSAMQAALETGTSAGLQVVFGSHRGVFLARIPGSGGPVAYRAISEGNADRVERALNIAGQQGFRLIPATLTRAETGNVAVMRRSAEGSLYRYRVVPFNDGFENNLQGSSLIGVFTQQSGIASLGRPGRLYAVLEISDSGPTSDARSRDQVRVVSTLRASTLEKEINEIAARGFRVFGGSFMNVLLQRDGPREYTYRVVGAIRTSTLTNEINEAGRAGFRLVRSAIMNNPSSKLETVVVMEHAPAETRRYDYEWLSASRINTDGVDTLTSDGFVPVALVRFGVNPTDDFGNQEELGVNSYFVAFERAGETP